MDLCALLLHADAFCCGYLVPDITGKVGHVVTSAWHHRWASVYSDALVVILKSSAFEFLNVWLIMGLIPRII